MSMPLIRALAIENSVVSDTCEELYRAASLSNSLECESSAEWILRVLRVVELRSPSGR
jgi:hypothetical protein